MGVCVDFGNGKKAGLSDDNPGGLSNAKDRGDKLDSDDSEVKKVRTGKPGFANGGILKKAKPK